MDNNNEEKLTLNCVSLFSGIEAFSVAASRIPDVNWKMVFFSEIDPCPCAVLKYHYPDVPNLGDICKIKADSEKGIITNGITTIAFPRDGIDLLVGGSPCQDVSVAGKRAGMSEGAETRSSLAFEYSRLVDELRPRIILWENVPGVLSSNHGLDFAAFLNSLVKRGYLDLSFRVLDSQYTIVDSFPHAIPQRRKRVWVVGVRSVGCFGADEPVSAQVLLEHPSLYRNLAPSRKAGQGFAAPVGYGPLRHDSMVEGSGLGNLRGGGGRTIRGEDVSNSLIASDYKGPGNTQDAKTVVTPLVEPALGFDARMTAMYGKGATGEEVAMTQDANQYKGGKCVSVPQATAIGVSFDGRKDAPIIEECAHTQTIGTNPGWKDGVCVSASDPKNKGFDLATGNLFVSAPLCAVDGKGANGTDICGKIAIQPSPEEFSRKKSKDVNCLCPEQPSTHRVYGTDGAYPTVVSNANSGQDQSAIFVESTNETTTGFRAGGFATYVKDEAAGTLDRDHCAGIANGTPALIVTSKRTSSKSFKNDSLAESDVAGTITGDHESRVTDTGQSIVTSFTQNQREEVRDLQNASGTISANGGSHQQTLICCNSPQANSTTTGYGLNVAPTMGAAAGESGNNKPFIAMPVKENVNE